MDRDHHHATFDKDGRRLVGMTATASGPVGQDKKSAYWTNDREGRMPFIEGKTNPKDTGTPSSDKVPPLEDYE